MMQEGHSWNLGNTVAQVLKTLSLFPSGELDQRAVL